MTPTTLIYALALTTAFASFVQEMNLAQALSGALGGTILRYHTGIGLFTCFLGFGAWAFDSFAHRFAVSHILLVAQASLCLLGVLGPAWIWFLDPLSHSLAAELPLTVLAYLPLVTVAFLSGLELPAFMSFRADRARLRVLVCDYVGMFAAAIVFPTLLLPYAGVMGAAVVSTALNLFCLLVLWRIRSPVVVAPETPVVADAGALPRPLIAVLLVSFSFCSVAYELLTAKAVSDFILDEVLAHSVTIGLFLIGLGMGTLAADRIRRTQVSLLNAELALATFAGLAFPALSLLALWWETTLHVQEFARSSHWAILLFSPVPLALGGFAGFELPLLLRAWGPTDAYGTPLGLNYAGALLAGFVVPLYLLPGLGVSASFTMVAVLNLCLALPLFWRLSRAHSGPAVIGLLLGSALLARSLPWGRELEQLFLKAHYFELRLGTLNPTTLAQFVSATQAIGRIERVLSPYQTIDLVHRDTSTSVFRQNSFTLYLNRQPQFTSDTWRTYHESMLFGSVNLAGKTPKSVLILGGGDGLLAAQTLQMPGVEHITLVELDPAMIELATLRPEIRNLNEGVFLNRRLELVRADAFRYVRRESRHFDAVFIDFPYPSSFELSRLFSVEFYASVRERINPGGYLVMDAPIWFDLDESNPELRPHEILLNTLSAAGFASLLAYGPIEPFIFATAEPRALAFDYHTLSEQVPNRTFVNLTPLDFLVKPYRQSPSLINSVYRPRRFLN